MRRGKFRPERWTRAQELASEGYTVTRAAQVLGIHHATAIYIAQRMGFKFAASQKGKYLRRPAETMGRVEKMMRLACK
jgi:predicted transcriptional regulator